MDELRWEGMEWERQTLRIIIPKTAQIEGKESRLAAIMPEAQPHLDQIFDETEGGAEFVLPRLAHKNYRQFIRKYLERAGIDECTVLLNNMRKSAMTDAHHWLPPHVCDT